MQNLIKNIAFVLLGTVVTIGVIFVYSLIDNGEMSDSEKAAYIDGYHAGIQVYNDVVTNSDDLTDGMVQIIELRNNEQKSDSRMDDDIKYDLITEDIYQLLQDKFTTYKELAEYECLENE